MHESHDSSVSRNYYVVFRGSRRGRFEMRTEKATAEGAKGRTGASKRFRNAENGARYRDEHHPEHEVEVLSRIEKEPLARLFFCI